MSESLRPESVVVSAGRPEHPGAGLNVPIVLTAPYRHDAEANLYARQASTDTARAFEAAIGALDGGTALAFASGMAALTAVVESRPVGSVAVVPTSAYSGTVSLFDEQVRLGRMTLRPVDIADTDAVLAALPGADLLWLETVTNPLLAVADLPALITAAHQHGALVGVDATFSTPLLARPLQYGADVVMHSATKLISGHSDLLMGVLVTAQPELGASLRARRDLTGAVPGALECYLALRGLRTLAVRLDRAQANALELARRLRAHSAVTRVRYPGLSTDPGYARASALYDGYGAMLSFEVSSAPAAETLCASVRLITHATSLGGVESLIERRARYEVDARHGTPPELLRLSVGIEHIEDLWADLAQALDASAD